MKFRKRTLIRIMLYGITALAILMTRNISLMRENKAKQTFITNSYLRALEDLAVAADNINSTLEKQLYAGTAEQQAALANKLFNEASNAKLAMSRLPVTQLNLEKTNKFLSQVGNYARAAADKSAYGQEPDKEYYNNLKKLHKFAVKLSDDLWKLEKEISCGEASFDEISDNYMEIESADVAESFTDYEKGFTSYPRLIYDGPFSDHIMEKQPEMTKSADTISKKKALQIASSAVGVSSNDLTVIYNRDGNMPAWIFSDTDGTVSCAVTLQGGYVSYFVKSRQPNSSELSLNDAIEKCSEYLKECGYSNMKVTYYERSGNTVTVNFAYTIDDIVCYTDLIKVTAALDNGEILGLEADGYLTNHTRRQFPEKTMSVAACKQLLSPYLKCVSSCKALIPLEGGKEAYCYEYKCKTDEGRNVLVYFNVRTGKEEQILILLESENGTLTI
ncbi:germination protein YpeB [Ruminococcus sp. YE71]|uniref:PepSY1/2 domain-containing protein n=1 Tax=unclassified Ruminococcus TaxID=2608920 RepID=UPI000886C206|nr:MULTISPECIES: PepSY1/2 domain-containing protein [unclassified Ruminococcus]SDA18991.1 germination protein YpeB [Ruminococcus sp. YE78]SFW28879.1 germination protein YpeB [Ruminococcus sp. YE71]